MLVSILEGIGDSFLDFTRSRLPGPFRKSVITEDLHEFMDLPRPSAGIEAPVFKGNRVSETLREPMVD